MHRRPKTGPRPIATVPAAGVTLAVAVAVVACCTMEFKLGRVRAFMSGVFEVAVEMQIEGWISVDFSGDLGAFANLPAFDDGEVVTDIASDQFSLAHVEDDIDDDASDEQLSVLRATGAGAPVTFVFWRGDAYTVDKGVCYLGWAEGGEVKLAANWCKQENGAMYCHMPGADEQLAYCERCKADGSCEACSMQMGLEECLPKKKDSGGLDLDIDIDIDIDIDWDLDVEPSVEGS